MHRLAEAPVDTAELTPLVARRGDVAHNRWLSPVLGSWAEPRRDSIADQSKARRRV